MPFTDPIYAIDQSLENNLSHREIVRKIYLTYPTKALIGREEQQYSILNDISIFFDIPINHIQICGSSKTGISFHKNSTFTPKESDLDIAIIDHMLFQRYVEIVLSATDGLKDRSKFSGRKYTDYIAYLAKGIFRPDTMPSCPERARWFEFFHKLSQKHKDFFKEINAGIYISQLSFEYKQAPNIANYISSKL